MNDNGTMWIPLFFMLILLGVGIVLVGGCISPTNEANNIHYTKVITPVYIDNTLGRIVDNNSNTYPIIFNGAYPYGKNDSLNKYKISNAISNNKSVTLTIQTICVPLGGCADVVSDVN